MKIDAIIQARMASTRLPGKALLPIEGKPVLWHIVNRLRQCKTIDRIIIATTANLEDNTIRDFAIEEGVPIWQGEVDDIINRLYMTCMAYDVNRFVRVTGDCPLVCPSLIDRMVELGRDIVINTIPRTWPDGFDLEIIPFDVLENYHFGAINPQSRKDLTQLLAIRPFTTFPLVGGNPSLRCTLDTPEDYKFIKQIFKEQGDEIWDYKTLIDYLKSHQN